MKTMSTRLLFVLVVLVAGCSQIDRAPQNNHLTITGSGNIVSREVEISRFDQVEAGITFDLTIRQGEDFSVVLFSDDNFIEYLQVEQSGGTISFDFIPGYAYDLHGVTLRAEVTMPELAGLRLSSSGHATLEDLKSTGNLDVELSGSSSLDGTLEAEKSSFVLSGSTYVKLSGSTEDLLVDACGSNLADFSDYLAGEATVQAGCASKVLVNVVDELDGDASQNSQVYYVSQPASSTITVHQSAFVGPQ